MDPTVVAAWIAAGVSALTLVGTGIAQYLGYHATSRDTERQLDRTLAEQRTQTLNERFATAAEQLGSDRPAVQLAGVYAMAGLADDWKENRQTCVDVLCAYLQLPYEPDPGPDAPEPKKLAFYASRKVRHTVIRVITAHLGKYKDDPASWQGLDLDFTGTVFDGGDFSNAEFSGGTVNFNNAQFSAGTVSFIRAIFSGGTVYFTGAEFSGGEVDFLGAQFSGGTVDFDLSRFSGGTVSFGNPSFPSGAIFSGGEVSFFAAKFTGGTVNFIAEFSGGTVDFRDAWFGSGKVDFSKAQFSGSTVDFRDASFVGGKVDFSRAADWSIRPEFPWTDTPPPGVKLPDTGENAEKAN